MRRFRTPGRILPVFVTVATVASLMTAVLAAIAAQPAGQAPASYTVLMRDGRRTLATRVFSGQEMFALDELAKMFDLAIREDVVVGALTVATKTQTIALTPGQALASAGGRVVSLPAAPVKEGQRWFVPIDFVPRALAPALGTRLELRRPSRLIVAGDVRVPRITARVEPQNALTRVTLEVTPATPHTVTQETNRLLVRFDADVLDVTFPASPVPDVLQALRVADPPVVIALDLGPRFASFRASDVPGDRGAGRIVIDLIAQTTEPAAPAAPTAQPPSTLTPAEPPLLETSPSTGLRIVVIDAGHGGDELGARGAQGTLEKDVTLAVARRLKAAIEARMGGRVILTRDGDQTVGLDERAAVANNNKADVFISLHANASVRTSAAGAEVFYLSLEDYGAQAQRAAQGDGEALPVFGGGTRDIEVILWEMAQARHIEDSAIFARLIEGSLRERVAMSPRAIQQAPFRVLVGANMPAVLVEMGFISNPEQEKQLASESFQTSIVQALVESLLRFRDTHGTQTPPPAAGARR